MTGRTNKEEGAAAGKPLRIACFGELLLRLGAPGRERLLQTPRLDVHVGVRVRDVHPQVNAQRLLEEELEAVVLV